MIIIKHLYLLLNDEGRIVACGSHPMGDSSIKVEDLDYLDDVLDNPSSYLYLDGKLVKDNEYELKLAIQEKDNELNKACEDAINYGFDHIINGVKYHFSADIKAQLNFQGTEALLNSGKIDSETWTVKNVDTGEYERININREIMDELSVKVREHISGHISRYRDDLYVKLMSAKTIEEVNNIKWEDDIDEQ